MKKQNIEWTKDSDVANKKFRIVKLTGSVSGKVRFRPEFFCIPPSPRIENHWTCYKNNDMSIEFDTYEEAHEFISIKNEIIEHEYFYL